MPLGYPRPTRIDQRSVSGFQYDFFFPCVCGHMLNLEVTNFIAIIVFCSVLGGILLVISLYAVLWVKSKEQKLEILESFQAKAAKECTEKRETEVTTTTTSQPQMSV